VLTDKRREGVVGAGGELPGRSTMARPLAVVG
jgi:hypothetical protein